MADETLYPLNIYSNMGKVRRDLERTRPAIVCHREGDGQILVIHHVGVRQSADCRRRVVVGDGIGRERHQVIRERAADETRPGSVRS